MKKILIVEDDFYIRDLYQMAFTKAQYTVEVAVDGEEALERVKNNNYDIILLDIMMPKVTGIDVLRSFRNENSRVKNTPVFLITNLGQDSFIKEAFKIGADGYFLKSQLTPKEIINEINAFLEKQATIQIANPPEGVTSN